MKIKQGNSFDIEYAPESESVQIDMREVTDLYVHFVKVFSNEKIPCDYSLSGGVVRVKVPATLSTGGYRLSVSFTRNGEQVSRNPFLFTIVSNVEDESKEGCSCIDIPTPNITDNIRFFGLPGKDGKSAYQIWLDNGHEGTEEDFLNWLKLDFEDLTPEEVALLQKPATDAAEDVEGRMFEIEQSYEVIQNDASVAIPAAMQAAIDANSAARLAGEKATLANSKAGLANDAATLANAKAELANTAAGNANSAATNANNAALAASNKIAELETYEDRLHELENNWTNNW